MNSVRPIAQKLRAWEAGRPLPRYDTIHLGDPPTSAGSCFDDEGDALTITITEQPTRGTAEVVSQGTRFASVRYSASSAGADSFKFKASDGNSDSNVATTTTTNVEAVNDPPQCSGLQQVQVEVGEPGTGTPCFDDEGDALTITITEQPTKGTLEIIGQGTPNPSLRYTATSVGPDSFSYKASDGNSDSNGATTTTTNVEAVNDPPQCFGLQNVQVEVGEPADYGCFDDEGGDLTITITEQPQKGTLEIIGQGTPNPSLRYTATSVGPDSFSYKASDGNSDSNGATTTTVNVDTKAPQTTIDAGPVGVANDSTPTFEFSASEPGSSFECSIDGGAFAVCSSPHTTASLADGAHTFAVRAIDAAGHPDPTPATRSFTLSSGHTGSGGGGGTGADGSGGGTLQAVAPAVIAGGTSAGQAKVSTKGRALLKTSVGCPGAGPSCSVQTTVTAVLAKPSTAAIAKPVKLGSSAFTVASGKSARVKIKLSRVGLRLLKSRKRINAKVKIAVTRAGKSTARTVKVTLKPPPRRP